MRIKKFSYSLTPSQSIWIDLIRAASAQGVLIGHLLFGTNFLSKEKYHFLFGLASYCVLIFFILSGFLICLSIINKQNYTFKLFFIDRFTRIYTAYLPSLIFIFFLDFISSKIVNKPFLIKLYIQEFIGNLFMMQEFPVLMLLHKLTNNNLFYSPYFGTALPLWTLSVEWWLYMLFGWIILQKKHNVILWWMVVVFFSIVPLYQLFIGSHMEAGITIYWFLGCLLPILLSTYEHVQIDNQVFAKITLIVGLFGFMYSFFVGAFIFMFGFFLLLKYYEQHEMKLGKGYKEIVKTLAKFSFSLYLIHYSFIEFLFSIVPKLHSLSLFNRIFVVFVFVNLIAYIFAYFTEFHYQKLRTFIKEKIIL